VSLRSQAAAASAVPVGIEHQANGWAPLDLGEVLFGDQVEFVPTLLSRSDGEKLLYPGRTHSFQGEPESLKSWLAQVASAEVLRDGGIVLYLDLEDDPRSVTGRLRDLGCTAQQIHAGLRYVQPNEAPVGREMPEQLLDPEPTLVVVDAVTEAMSLFGLDPSDNADAAEFYRLVPRPFTAVGATVVVIDHVTKAGTGGRWALGAQHKLAAIDGAAYRLETGAPSGRGRKGTAKIFVVKDRNGYIRGLAEGTRVAELHLNSETDGSVEAALDPPETNFRPTILMERISDVLAGEPGERFTRTQVYEGVAGKRSDLQKALNKLVEEGFVARTLGAADPVSSRCTSLRTWSRSAQAARRRGRPGGRGRTGRRCRSGALRGVRRSEFGVGRRVGLGARVGAAGGAGRVGWQACDGGRRAWLGGGIEGGRHGRGADSIDDMDLPRHGAMGRLFLGVREPSTLQAMAAAVHRRDRATSNKLNHPAPPGPTGRHVETPSRSAARARPEPTSPPPRSTNG